MGVRTSPLDVKSNSDLRAMANISCQFGIQGNSESSKGKYPITRILFTMFYSVASLSPTNSVGLSDTSSGNAVAGANTHE